MQQNFVVWLNFAWRTENDGQGVHTDPGDPGGETNRGVIAMTWAEFVRKGYVQGTLADATVAQLTLILRLDCWHACHCDVLPIGIDVMLADMAMVAGAGAAVRCLQRTINVEDDGFIGPETLYAVENYPYSTNHPAKTSVLLSALLKADDAYYASLDQFRLWGHGWERRADDCATLCDTLIFA